MDEKTLRGFIEAQMCPWCPKGPFKVLAKHTYRAHGIGGPELRERAGLYKRASICSPEEADHHRALVLARLEDPAYKAKVDARMASAATRKRQLSRAGLAQRREHVAGFAGSGNAAKEAAKAELHESMLSLWKAGLTVVDIADVLDVSHATVSASLRRAYGLAAPPWRRSEA